MRGETVSHAHAHRTVAREGAARARAKRARAPALGKTGEGKCGWSPIAARVSPSEATLPRRLRGLRGGGNIERKSRIDERGRRRARGRARARVRSCVWESARGEPLYGVCFSRAVGVGPLGRAAANSLVLEVRPRDIGVEGKLEHPGACEGGVVRVRCANASSRFFFTRSAHITTALVRGRAPPLLLRAARGYLKGPPQPPCERGGHID